MLGLLHLRATNRATVAAAVVSLRETAIQAERLQGNPHHLPGVIGAIGLGLALTLVSDLHVLLLCLSQIDL